MTVNHMHAHTSKYLVLLVTLLVTIVFVSFTRLYNISGTARFTLDEASDLARLYQLGNHFKLTLVGPISSDNSKVFGSLTYYLQLPFVMMLSYSTVSPAIGTAFWSIITAVLIVLLSYKVNKSLLLYISVLVIVWYPLVETGRWAWNPHFILLWMFVALLLYIRKKRLTHYLAGVFFGLSFHHHYVSIIALSGFLISEAINILLQPKNERKEYTIRLMLLFGGILSSLLPFLLFDLRHPPGLFITRYILGGEIPNVTNSKSDLQFTTFGSRVTDTVDYLAAHTQLKWIIGFGILSLIFVDLKRRAHYLLSLLPVLLQLCFMTLIDRFALRYFLPAIPFFILWMLLYRKDRLSIWMVKIVFFTLILASVIQLPKLLSETRVEPSPASAEKIVQVIRTVMLNNPTDDANLSVVASLDGDPVGELYRAVLGMYGIQFDQALEYSSSNRLFAISTSDELSVRNNPDYSISFFKHAKLNAVYTIDNSNWKVYWFQK